MSPVPTAVITVAHGRHGHLALQEAGLRSSTVAPTLRFLVALDDPAILAMAGSTCIVQSCNSASVGALPLAAARNRGADEAIQRGARLLIFLDVDCVPAPSMISNYQRAYRHTNGAALLSGPVTYLPPAPTHGYQLAELAAMGQPHPARPNPAPGILLRANDYRLFWSLSFAVSVPMWQRLGGFCEDYIGYGAEDTDFGAIAQAADVPFYWVGGANAYHQHHPVSDPPFEHLTSIVRNARIFHRRWGWWPMGGWLDAFEAQGLIRRDTDAIELTSPTPFG